MIRLNGDYYFTKVEFEKVRLNYIRNDLTWETEFNPEDFDFIIQSPDDFLLACLDKKKFVGAMYKTSDRWHTMYYENFLKLLFPKHFQSNGDHTIYLSESGKVYVSYWELVGYDTYDLMINKFKTVDTYLTSVVGPFRKEILGE